MEEKQKKTGERSSFAVTCSLLSQFLKENRDLGKLGIDKLHCSQDKEKSLFRPPTTMNLFPGSNVSADNRNEPDLSEKTATMPVDPPPQLQDKDAIFKAPNRVDQEENEINAQLTIFYDGKVMVFDDFPAKKVKDLMEMAGKSALQNSCPTPLLQHEPITSVDLTMPIARRASLHRFLEKRKDRSRLVGNGGIASQV
ncbi:protein TIFY 10c-like isoform X2 [Phalaenopsis equestris]|uniref:protein TIFY 10c-like isoform X2 n=1 Tax=Phalaenopsis equestris TaxID=78828 RepID=UPI0009E23939|nr:protein TIFY 10c-like isoform X2 [Phalaenopsis equestris]